MGKISTSTSENQTKGKKLKAYCTQCGNDTNHVVLHSTEVNANEIIDYHDNQPVTIEWEDSYQVIQCQGCDTISFRHYNWFSENQEYYGPNEGSDGTTVNLYPNRSKNLIIPKDFYNTPYNISRIYKETLNCFNNEDYVLCAAGLRAVIEGICAERSVIDGPIERIKKDGTIAIDRKDNLEGKISGLCEKNLLSTQHSKILHEHRFLGNDAVHELLEPSHSELKLAIEIIEHTLETLYEIPEKGAVLKAKRMSRVKKS